MVRLLALILVLLQTTCTTAQALKLDLISVEKIWDHAPHNAFTDLIRHKDRWFCAFREGAKHVSPDGAIRVLSSSDGKNWESLVHLTSSTEDLRDPKLCITPDGKLMLTAAGAAHMPMGPKHQTYAWFSADGKVWGEPTPIGERGYWLWRVNWSGSTAYGIGYETGTVRDCRLYRSTDGRKFECIVKPLSCVGRPSEAGMVFQPDGTCICLQRRDGSPTGQLGRAKPPYTEWTWRDLDKHVGGPQLIALADGRLLAGGRLKDDKVRTALCALNLETAALTELLSLPSAGDSSYPGMVCLDGELWMSYYSSHEKKASIYLTRVKLH